MDSFRDRTLALAGLFQAARLAQQFSREGRADPSPFAASLRSVLQIDAENIPAIFGGAGGITLGLRLLHEGFGGHPSARDIEVAKYVLSMMQLEANLRRRTDVIEAIRDGLRAIQSQMSFFEALTDGNAQARLVEKLAELYTRTLSTLNPRILVNGEQGFLANPAIAASVRAALFAGIRSAFLWHQLGGNRWHLLFSRRKFAAEAARWLQETPSS